GRICHILSSHSSPCLDSVPWPNEPSELNVQVRICWLRGSQPITCVPCSASPPANSAANERSRNARFGDQLTVVATCAPSDWSSQVPRSQSSSFRAPYDVSGTGRSRSWELLMSHWSLSLTR